MIKKILIAILVSYVSFVSAGERLSGDELKSYYTDKTIISVHFKLGPGKTFFGEDGRVRSVSENGTERNGKWWIEGDKRCVQWDDKNKAFCHYTERNEDGTHTLIHSKNGKALVEELSTEEGNQL